MCLFMRSFQSHISFFNTNARLFIFLYSFCLIIYLFVIANQRVILHLCFSIFLLSVCSFLITTSDIYNIDTNHIDTNHIDTNYIDTNHISNDHINSITNNNNSKCINYIINATCFIVFIRECFLY